MNGINPKEVSSIGVVHEGKLLMGRRRDNGRWTLPGGHLNDGEHHHDGALRELKEETGINAELLDHLGSHDVITHSGKHYKIHAYKHEGKQPVTVKNDPDKEVERWQWIDITNGLPKDVLETLHSPKNVVLQCLGLQPKDTEEPSLARVRKKLEMLKSMTIKEDEEASPLMNRIEDKYFVPRIYLNKLTLRLKEKLHEGDIDTFVRYNLNQTIYLDNKDLDCFRANMENEKPRFKVRIRRYAPNGEKWEDVAYAELKMKTDGAMTNKVRIRIPEASINTVMNGGKIIESERLMDLNRDISKDELNQRILQFNNVVEKYGLRKAVIITYERRAYSDPKLRITVDDTIRCRALMPLPQEIKENIESGDWKKFTKPLKQFTQSDYLVVEVKHQEGQPKWVKELLEECDAKQVKFSKYCAAVYSCLFPRNEVRKSMALTDFSEAPLDEVGEKIALLKSELLTKPYVSEAQRRWAHTETGKEALGGEKAVHEWDESTKGKKLPETVKSEIYDPSAEKPETKYTHAHMGYKFGEISHPNVPEGHRAYEVKSPEGHKDIYFAKNPEEMGPKIKQVHERGIKQKMTGLKAKVTKKSEMSQTQMASIRTKNQ